MAYIDKHGVEFSDDKKTLVRCPENYEGEYVVPNDVTTIGEGAFRYCEHVTAITFPKSLKHIKEEAFRDCKQVETIILPNDLETLGDDAFHACGQRHLNIKNDVIIPASIKEIGNNVFAFSGLRKVSFEEGFNLEATSTGMFMCTEIKEITLPTSIKKVSKRTFEKCRNLHTIVIKNGDIIFANDAFDGCSNLSKVIVPKGRKNWILKRNQHLHNYYPVVGVRRIEDIIEESEI